MKRTSRYHRAISTAFQTANRMLRLLLNQQIVQIRTVPTRNREFNCIVPALAISRNVYIASRSPSHGH